VHVRQLFDLSGRTALVTGGGRGLGRHIAIGLAEAGADVMVASRKLANCEETVREIEARGRRGAAFAADLGSGEEVVALAERVLAATPRLDILVNNSAMIWGAPTLDFPIEAWDRVFAVNVRGLWLLSQRVARHMKEKGGGSIIHVTSISAFRGADEAKEQAIAYGASKGAVTSLMLDMAVKLAPDGVRVNAIAPGPFYTSMMDPVRHDPEKLAKFHEQLPQGRSGGEDDIKGAAVFLASDASAFVTGHTLVVDGGWLAR
jgi:gluconate 5-dehydrogenase